MVVFAYLKMFFLRKASKHICQSQSQIEFSYPNFVESAPSIYLITSIERVIFCNLFLEFKTSVSNAWGIFCKSGPN